MERLLHLPSHHPAVLGFTKGAVLLPPGAVARHSVHPEASCPMACGAAGMAARGLAEGHTYSGSHLSPGLWVPALFRDQGRGPECHQDA